MRSPHSAPVLVTCLCFLAQSAVVRTSRFGTYAEALRTCKPGDALVFDGGTETPLADPPSDLQIIGGSASWTITRDVADLLFFNHGAPITQTGGIMKRCQVYPGGNGCSFVGLDSCLFRPKELYGWWNKGPRLLVDGFLRATSFVDLRTGNTSSNDRWNIGHASSLVINATHPTGDGRGSFVGHWLCWGQTDWTNLHIVNGRGITVAHFNSEYPTWADPMVIIENGYECYVTSFTPGGYEPSSQWSTRRSTLSDGTTAYHRLAYRNGLYRIGGQANGIVGGTSYKSFQSVVTGKPWLDLNVRDPYFSKWNADRVTGINFAPAKGQISFNDIDWVTWKDVPPHSSMLVSETSACTTFFADAEGAVVTSALKGRPLRPGPRLRRPYFPRLPTLRGGLGNDLSGRSGSQILLALNAGATVYLGPGTYQVPGTINAGKVYGAGMDETILEFPSGARCFDGGGGSSGSAYNLTVKGGKVGYAQTRAFSVISLANVRFVGQSVCGLSLGNAQNVYFGNLEFDNCGAGVMACQDGVPCGEDMTPDGASMIDKICFYACTFRNMKEGIALGVGNNGYCSFYGCHFEDLDDGIRIWRSKGSNGKCRGYHVSGCTFVNCRSAASISGHTDVDNCTVTSSVPGARGFAGSIASLVNCSIKGCDTAAACGSRAVVAYVESDGVLEYASSTWIGASVFRNVAVPNGARIGETDLSRWVDAEPVPPDHTPPSAPGNVRVSPSASGTVIEWDPSSDRESGVAFYLIERNGAELDRTGYSYCMDPAKQASQFATGYRETTRFVDTQPIDGAHYGVVAVNSAHIRSDGAMARLRTWPHSWAARGDSAFVPHGEEIPYTAVKFHSQGEEPISVVRHSLRRAATAPRVRRSAVTRCLFDIRGRQVSAPGPKSTQRAPGNGTIAGATGVYVTAGRRARILSVRRGGICRTVGEELGRP